MDIDGYEKIADLGKGGMAFVYKSRHKDLDRVVALKVMDQKFNFDVSFTQRFQREAKISAKLAHKHIVQIYDVGVFNGSNYLSMEYVPGGDLSDLLEQNKHLTEGTIVECIKQMASALDFAASKHVVHRDVKPANILIRGDNDFVLADFGIAKNDDTSSNLTEVGSIIGTPSYMSPEQSKGQALDHRSDLYSLGVVFYQLLCNKVPYEGDSALSVGIKHINAPIPPLIPQYQKYQHIIDKLLAKSPSDRFQSGTELISALNLLNDNTEIDAPTLIVSPQSSIPPEVGGLSSKKISRKTYASVFSVLVVMVVTLAYYVFMSDTTKPAASTDSKEVPTLKAEPVLASTPQEPTSAPSIKSSHLAPQFNASYSVSNIEALKKLVIKLNADMVFVPAGE